jgi:murein DD-endopeptidase MepM/ murein hydrolase activator NlpD
MKIICQKCHKPFRWAASQPNTLYYRLCRQIFSVQTSSTAKCPHCGIEVRTVVGKTASKAIDSRTLKAFTNDSESTVKSKISFVGLLMLIFLLSAGMYRVFIADDSTLIAAPENSLDSPKSDATKLVSLNASQSAALAKIEVTQSTSTQHDALQVKGLDESNPDAWMDYIASQLGDEFGKQGFLPKGARLTSGFGYRVDPFINRWRFHHGLDIAMKMGTPVKALMPGKVIYAGYAQHYGRVIFVEHPHDLVTIYGHLSKVKVKEGQEISQHELIGNVGSSGRSTGPHLHFEVRLRNKKLDPTMIPQFNFLTKAAAKKSKRVRAS